LPDKDARRRFEQTVLPHLDAAYNLARWLSRSDEEARDIVQEAFLRAYRFFGSFHGEEARPWLLAIVRNTFLTLHHQQSQMPAEEFSEELHSFEPGIADVGMQMPQNPEEALLAQADREAVNRAMEGLPLEFREIMVMRELNGLSYKEIALIADIPIGTVMSRLARGRKLLEEALAAYVKEQ
jgi:RNA polymerase sigma factor (sigma-70 family)